MVAPALGRGAGPHVWCWQVPPQPTPAPPRTNFARRHRGCPTDFGRTPCWGFAAALALPDDAVRVRGSFWHTLWSRDRVQAARLRFTLYRLKSDARTVTGSQVKSAVWKLNADAGRGLDAWSGRELRALPEEAFEELADILNAIMADVS